MCEENLYILIRICNAVVSQGITYKGSQHNSKIVTFLHVFFLSHIPMSITSMDKKNGLCTVAELQHFVAVFALFLKSLESLAKIQVINLRLINKLWKTRAKM